ncbi:TonB-dependent receptor [Pararcticibacter amylolyticus]|uniref:TonB-dependent receptor n=1 Tax=Pararcticibacter amylolyticus TaxID=2173175 RepID=A0A2U2PHK9_9SPHI|nr:TonB-dependent receptor [Pararcticibacter amylolyticus]PWG80744.1 TonB-dependent receptor [Pararcticibacter amylolyticus]
MKKILLSLVVVAMIVASAVNAYAQEIVKGKVVDASTKEALPGASVLLKGTKKSVSTGLDGSFSISATSPGTLVISYIGYIQKEIEFSGAINLGNIQIEPNATSMQEVTVTGNVAIDRKTPVAFSTVKAVDIESKGVNREFPELLKSTPSVYTTKAGGAFGDSRIVIRGFSQENIAVMVNGVPVNDMENQRVYWSNWAGLTDVTSSMQVQRGLGASKLSVSSVGGTINIVTKPTEMTAGGSVSANMGNDDFMKYTVSYSSGKLPSGLALTVLGSLNQGDGYVQGTQYRGWNWFASLGYEINSKHLLTFTATGAPQWHNQRSFSLPYQTYYGNPNDPSVIARGSKYNDSWGYLNGEEFNAKKNFYHKPVFNLNHYWNISDKLELNSIAYYSIGRGGGTAASGRINNTTYERLPRTEDGLINWDDISKWNSGTAVNGFGAQTANTPIASGTYQGQYQLSTSGNNSGISRISSMNEHNWYGLISNLGYRINDKFNLSAGIDYRGYKGLHYQRVEDFIGGDVFFETKDANENPKYILNGDKKSTVGYDNPGYVQQYGGQASLEYTYGSWDIFVAGAANNTSYQREDKFLASDDENRKTPKYNYFAYTAKGGANYRIDEKHNVFANIGYFTRAPFYNAIFAANSNLPNKINKDLENEKVFGTELGYSFRSRVFSANVNLYRTMWSDKTISGSSYVEQGVRYRDLTVGAKQLSQGLEIDMATTPIRKLELTGMFSLGNFEYKDNAQALKINDDTNTPTSDFKTVYIKGLKVGDVAHVTYALGASYEVVKNVRVRADLNSFDKLYARYLYEQRTAVESAGTQPWQLPSYTLVDAGVSYRFNLYKTPITLRFNVDNIFDEKYIAESYTDTKFDPTDATDFEIGKGGSGKRNTVFPGWGRTWNLGLKVNF